MKTTMPQSNQNPEALPMDSAPHGIKLEQHSPEETRRVRKTPEQRLDEAERKARKLQTRINRLKTTITENNRKKRTRQLVLVGVVLEQLFKKGVFKGSTPYGTSWWKDQAALLPEKDRALYTKFITALLGDG